MDSYLFKNDQDFYSFVSSAFVNEAKIEKKHIYLEYQLKKGIRADVYLPKGLTMLEEYLKKSFKTPYVVEINSSLSQEKADGLRNLLASIGFEGTLFHISQKEFIEQEHPSNAGFEMVFLDWHFVDELRKRNRNVYLNQALGALNSVLTDNSLSIYDGMLAALKTFSDSTKEVIKIDKADPDNINKVNENDFKAFLNGKGNDSNCAVFIGNGASIPFGSDNWSNMIKNLLDRLAPFHIEKSEHVYNALSGSSYAISSFVKSTLINEENEDEYFKALRYCIYRKYNEIMHDQESLVNVIARAKAKYKNLPLLTYNYDTFVERQFFHNKAGSLNYYCGDSQSSYDVGVLGKDSVIHLHGYISYRKDNRKNIVLTDEDYFKAYYREDSWTFKTQIQALTDYTCLFVGSSMSDLFQMSLIQRAKEANSGRGRGLNCFALMCFEGLDSKEKMKILKYYKGKGVRIIFSNSFDDLPTVMKRLFSLR